MTRSMGGKVGRDEDANVACNVSYLHENWILQ